MGRPIPYQAIPEAVVRICRRLGQAGFAAHIVGGAVRDLLLGRSVDDWDVATDARPTQVQLLFSRTVPTGIRHGTVTVLPEARRDPRVEVTTFRGEGAYSDGRHPDSVTFVGSLLEDLKRRDFTVNAMALDPVDQDLADPLGGEADLQARLIRAVGDPLARFSEDGLRPLRAVRLAAVLEFSVTPGTLAAIPAALAVLRKVSWERIRDELLKMLRARRPSLGLELMRQTGLLEEVLPELAAGAGLHQNRHHPDDVLLHSFKVCDVLAGDPLLRLAGLLHDVGKPKTARPHPERPGERTFPGHDRAGARLCQQIVCRLRLSRAEQQWVCRLVEHHAFALEGWSGPGLRRFVRRVGPVHLPDLLALKEADIVTKHGAEQRLALLQVLRQRLQQVMEREPPLGLRDLAISGREVMARLGIPPGPVVGRILAELLERVLEEPALNEPESLLRLVDELGSGQRDGVRK